MTFVRECCRSHNSQVVPGAPNAPTYATTTRGSMSGLAQAVINRVLGNRTDSATSSTAGQGNSPRAHSGTSPRALSGRWLSLLSRGVKRDSCPQTPLTGVEPHQDPAASFGKLCHMPLPIASVSFVGGDQLRLIAWSSYVKA